jgi:hypothetical protein
VPALLDTLAEEEGVNFPYRGGIATFLLAVLLLTPPAGALERDGAFADTSGNAFSGNAVSVRLKDTLKTDLNAIPATVGEWHSRDDNSWPAILQRYLAYDALLVRDYTRPGLYVGIQLMVLSARHAAAFHDPEICFQAQDGIVEPLTPTEFQVEGVSSKTNVSVGRLRVTYPGDEAPRLVYNLYVVERHLLAPDRTTWIRFTAQGHAANNITAGDELIRPLAEQLIPSLFTASGQARTMFEWIQVGYGAGFAVLAAAVAGAPLALESVLLARRKR